MKGKSTRAAKYTGNHFWLQRSLSYGSLEAERASGECQQSCLYYSGQSKSKADHSFTGCGQRQVAGLSELFISLLSLLRCPWIFFCARHANNASIFHHRYSNEMCVVFLQWYLLHTNCEKRYQMLSFWIDFIQFLWYMMFGLTGISILKWGKKAKRKLELEKHE